LIKPELCVIVKCYYFWTTYKPSYWLLT